MLLLLLQEFELIEKKELAPLQELIERLTSIQTTPVPTSVPPSAAASAAAAGYSNSQQQQQQAA